MGRYDRAITCPTNFQVGCRCKMCNPRAQGGSSRRNQVTSAGYDSGSYGHIFDGKPAKVKKSGGTIHVFYGGEGIADGPGHGHVKATGGPSGENIVLWRLPASEGGRTIVSNSMDEKYGNDLNDYLS